MLNCTANSRAKKTFNCGVTYRAGSGDMFSTCPDSCTLKPRQTKTKEIDREYERVVRDAVPRRGVAFLFTHFPPAQWAEPNQPKKTVFNYSADTLEQCADSIKAGAASVAVVAHDYWDKLKSKKATSARGVKMIRCLDETTGIGCAKCGGSKGPLCARMDRDFGVVFTAHGAAKKKAGNNEEPGGCYAGGGNVALHWRNLSHREQSETDGEKLKSFVKSLVPGTTLRHHIAGDLGAIK